MLLPVRTVGVMGDHRTYDNVCALRAVTSTDGMTADIYPFDAAFLSRVATRIVNEVQGHQPGGLRLYVEAAGHDRVGIAKPPGNSARTISGVGAHRPTGPHSGA